METPKNEYEKRAFEWYLHCDGWKNFNYSDWLTIGAILGRNPDELPELFDSWHEAQCPHYKEEMAEDFNRRMNEAIQHTLDKYPNTLKLLEDA